MEKRRYLKNENYINGVIGKNLASMPNDVLYMIDSLKITDGIIRFDRVREQIIQAYHIEDKKVLLKLCISNMEKLMKTVNKTISGYDCASCDEYKRNLCFTNWFKARYVDED